MTNTIYDKKNPFPGKLLKNIKLSKDGSGKETRHLEISIAGSGIEYKCGDALAVFPHNDPELVEEILKVEKYSGNESVAVAERGHMPLRQALIEHFNLQNITSELLENLDTSCQDNMEKELTKKFLDPGFKKTFKEEYFDVLDVLHDLTHTRLSPQDLINSLKPIRARLYSIASSPTRYPEEIHLCIVVNNTFLKGRLRKGIASNYISHDVGINEKVEVYLSSNNHFVLPEGSGIPIIMVGPGTGIAPFRGFLQEREARGDKGKNWLFFGEQKQEFDFLYEEEFNSQLKSGHLTRLDTAFSRDQEHKIYVQDRMRENAKEFFAWLEAGAIFYVCGDAKRMAVDVDNALHDIIRIQGNMDEETAKEYVKDLKRSKRYVRDIY